VLAMCYRGSFEPVHGIVFGCRICVSMIQEPCVIVTFLDFLVAWMRLLELKHSVLKRDYDKLLPILVFDHAYFEMNSCYQLISIVKRLLFEAGKTILDS
jgi:hypothetical protein